MSEQDQFDPNDDGRTAQERQAAYERMLRENVDAKIASAEVELTPAITDDARAQDENVPDLGAANEREPDLGDLENERYGRTAELEEERYGSARKRAREYVHKPHKDE